MNGVRSENLLTLLLDNNIRLFWAVYEKKNPSDIFKRMDYNVPKFEREVVLKEQIAIFWENSHPEKWTHNRMADFLKKYHEFADTIHMNNSYDTTLV